MIKKCKQPYNSTKDFFVYYALKDFTKLLNPHTPTVLTQLWWLVVCLVAFKLPLSIVFFVTTTFGIFVF